MSSTVLARKRRANGVVEKPVQQESAQPTAVNAPVPKKGMQLSHILNVIDSRLKALESTKPDTTVTSETQEKGLPYEMVQEYEARFQMLATEINDIKDMLLKLQSFTMEVNKTLFDERVSTVLETNEKLEETVVAEESEQIEEIEGTGEETEGVNFS